MSKIIEVTQKPIIAYSLLQEMSDKVALKIESLNIDTLEPTDENLSIIKSTRAELNNDFKTLEEQRKMVKDIVLKDYNIFEEQYKTLISTKFKDADATLKRLVSTVDSRILDKKIVGIREYFMDNNTREWIRFEDLGLHIIKSKSDKSIKEDVDSYLDVIKVSLETIDTLDNKERVLAKFQMCKDLNRAISETNLEIQREERIKAQNEERARLQAEALERQKQAQEEQERVVNDRVMEEPVVDEKIYKTSFTVFGTKAQFSELKQFMENRGLRYE